MSQSEQARPSKSSAPQVSQAVEQQIDENLKRLYAEALEQDLPEALKALVARLRTEGGGK